MVDGENGHTHGHKGHHKVFIERVRFPEYGEVEEHNGKKLARLGKNECYIINVSERSVSERGGQRRSHCHQDERKQD